MKKIRLTSLLLCFLILCSSTGCSNVSQEEEQLHITATTYPLYVLVSAITAGSDHVDVHRLNTGSVSCLHDYTLTVSDMRHLEQADVLIMNGAELETFLDSALSQLNAIQIDCSLSADLLEGDSHEHHSHGEHEKKDDHDHDHGHTHEHDAHYWMDPRNMISAAESISHALAEIDPANKALYTANAQTVGTALQAAYDGWYSEVCDFTCPYLITFHDGFYYFAEAFNLEILFSMEEEDGATASAKDILMASSFVKEYGLPAIFAEVNGSGAAARAVSGETGAEVFQLSMLMAGDDAPSGADAETIIKTMYISPMNDNIKTLSEVLK